MRVVNAYFLQPLIREPAAAVPGPCQPVWPESIRKVEKSAQKTFYRISIRGKILLPSGGGSCTTTGHHSRIVPPAGFREHPGPDGPEETLRKEHAMHRFKKILLVYDPSPSGVTSLAKAVDLVERNEAELTVVAVIDEIPRDYRMLLTAMTPEEIMSLARKDTLSRLEEYIAPFSETGRVTTRVLVGQESIAIIREVLRNGHDLVMKTARGMGGKLGMLFGSTAMHLLRKCPCPVWILKPEENRRFYRRIMAALDILPAEAEESGLNKKIMELTISMAEIEGSEIHIVHVAENPDDHLLLGALYIPPEEIGRWSRETRNMRIGKLDEFLEEFDLADLQHQEHVLQGWADEEIPQFANEYKIDLLVMGTLARTGIPGLFIGNTAEKILHRVNCSVLAVKPDGFISPVTLDED